MSWVDAGAVEDIPRRGARVFEVDGEPVALFRTGDEHVFALRDRCPHRGGPLSQGMVHGHRVTCPLHEWVIELGSGRAVAPDEGCATVFDVRVEDGRVLVRLPEPAQTARASSTPGAAESERAASGAPTPGAVEHA